MKPFSVVMEFDKETKNTIRFREVTEGMPPAIGTIYIQKWKKPPRKIRLTIEPTD